MIIRTQKQHPPQSSQDGFTIIESLMAIIVVAVLLIGLSPIIVVSTGARLQARRVERATEAAKTYVDGVQSGSITAPTAPAAATTVVNTAPAPAGTLTCTIGGAYCTSPPNIYCVDLDQTPGCQANSLNDFIVQGSRSSSDPAATDDAQKGYRLGVRVYRADAFKEAGVLKTNGAGSIVTQAAFRGNTLGDRKAPVVEMVTDIAPTGKKYKDSLDSWCDRLQPAVANPNSGC